MIQVTPVILCGGSGTRLWPLSRTGFPKQFLCLTGNESLFQQAAQRLAALGSEQIQVASPVIVSGVNAGRNFPTLAGRIFPHPWEFWAVSPALKTGTPF